jgi:phospholipid/cholesterol/gamma-HCH transport system substrate-binding protein
MIQQANTPGAPPSDGKRGARNDPFPTVPMRSSRREIQIGFFVLAGIVAVIVALMMLTDPGTFRGRYDVATMVRDAGGLRKGDPVQMRGVNIGRVRRFVINPEGVVISLEMEQEYEVPADSRIQLESGGLLGGMIVEVIPGNSEELLEDGDVLPGTNAGGVFDAAANVGARADTVLARTQQLLSPGTIQAVGTSAQELQTLLADLSALAAQQRQEIAALSASLRRSATGVERAATRPELERSVARMDSISLQLDRATASLDRSTNSLEAVLGRIERGEGTLGKLSRDESLYDNLNRAAANTNALVEDIQKNPKKYINVKVF